MSNMNLKKELRMVGAGEHEAGQLADVAKLLGSVKTRGLSAEAKKRLAPDTAVARAPRTWIAWTAGGAFATACLLLIVAQSALPGSWLYNIKRGTEKARAAVQPGYQETLVEKREDEVEQLMLKKADPAVLEEAEKRYQKSVDKNQNTNYQPRYDWSRRWFQNRQESGQNTDSNAQTQSWQSDESDQEGNRWRR